MAGLSPTALLSAWEAGSGRAPLDQALGVLWAAGHRDDVADWPLTTRDAALLALRIETFGDSAEMVAVCPECGTELELALPLSEVLPDNAGADNSEVAGIRLRPMTSRDLAAVVDKEEGDLISVLAERLAGEAVPEAVMTEISAHLEAREAERQITLALTCAECGALWNEALDVAAHVWAEVEASAARIMDDVARLAAAYGWTEAQCLALPQARRARYLALARAT